jgi:predicted ester cyclase
MSRNTYAPSPPTNAELTPAPYFRISGIREAYPDTEATIEDQIAEGDKVVTRFTSRGTHQGELWSIPATGRQVEVRSASTNRIEGRKIVEHWTSADRLA